MDPHWAPTGNLFFSEEPLSTEPCSDTQTKDSISVGRTRSPYSHGHDDISQLAPQDSGPRLRLQQANKTFLPVNDSLNFVAKASLPAMNEYLNLFSRFQITLGPVVRLVALIPMVLPVGISGYPVRSKHP